MPRRFIAKVKFSPKILNTFWCLGKITAVRFVIDSTALIVKLYFLKALNNEIIASLSPLSKATVSYGQIDDCETKFSLFSE